jgi:hypothetical protein
MERKYYIITFIFIAFTQIVIGQGIEKTFSGCWADSGWKFQFLKNGEFKRDSNGHYGNTTINGKYTIKNDTIQITSGYKNTGGTINEFYIIDENNTLIDTKLGYGYPLLVTTNPKNVIKCELQYPEIKAVNEIQISDFQTVLNLAFNTKEIKNYYHFDKIPSRKLIIANYNKLKAAIKVEGFGKAVFENKNQITDKFYLEFEEIYRYYDQISFSVKIHDEGAKIWFFYKKSNNEWKAVDIRVTEN